MITRITMSMTEFTEHYPTGAIAYNGEEVVDSDFCDTKEVIAVGKAKEEFYKLDSYMRENLLMETAMTIQELFDYMYYEANEIDKDKVDDRDSLERLQTFRDWAREFEEKYYGTDEYEDDFFGLSYEYATKKIEEVYGKED